MASPFGVSTINNEGNDDHQLNKDEIRILESIEKQVGNVNSLQSNYDIFRVPRRFHKLNPGAYTPLSISIGPLHGKEEHLQVMETHKLRYLHRLLNRPGVKITLNVLVKAMSNLEEKARKCYSESKGLEKDDFIKMMVMDGCFILEFLVTKTFSGDDHFVSNSPWSFEILSDLFKLENQLPFFVLERLHDLIFEGELRPFPEFTFKDLIYIEILNNYARGLHGPTISIPEQLRSLQLPEGGAKHFVDLLWHVLVPSSRKKNSGPFLPLSCCASELSSAGVKFQKKEKSNESSKTYLFDIDFDMAKGILTIPTITVHNDTELILRNLIAFEQGQNCIAYFTSYACFMEYLINTPKDAELLVRKGIIINYFGNAKDVVTLFSNLGKYTVLRGYYFANITKNLEDYHSKGWNKSKANLMQNYFNTPWASISVGAAALLLFLTIAQTICSIVQVK